MQPSIQLRLSITRCPRLGALSQHMECRVSGWVPILINRPDEKILIFHFIILVCILGALSKVGVALPDRKAVGSTEMGLSADGGLWVSDSFLCSTAALYVKVSFDSRDQMTWWAGNPALGSGSPRTNLLSFILLNSSAAKRIFLCILKASGFYSVCWQGALWN